MGTHQLIKHFPNPMPKKILRFSLRACCTLWFPQILLRKLLLEERRCISFQFIICWGWWFWSGVKLCMPPPKFWKFPYIISLMFSKFSPLPGIYLSLALSLRVCIALYSSFNDFYSHFSRKYSIFSRNKVNWYA